jgi:hypothetical protein
MTAIRSTYIHADGTRRNKSTVRLIREKREQGRIAAELEGRRASHTVKMLIEEASEMPELPRTLIGPMGHYIQPRDTEGVKFSVYAPDGTLHAIIGGEPAAEAACRELAETGAISR